ncbi:ABC transporter substrate-binding protein [Actinopolymorpha pittospori]|uniref:Polar amino acid transport system substrate-binding protein n=1 Tax=Actinopolymorpha pittospori TaxID=648752 RepID=A0A927RP02_9ACTN|nr:ABC transporter substrate-binding protein [Actinopolymorpha pittospori]MBE1611641.1 polar amino acid transport system substrate-binding protein [Actinopolymorpha pittospori]
MTRQLTRRALASCAVLVAAGATLAGCGGQNQPSATSSETPAATTSADNSLAALVPDAIRADGKIRIGTDASYAPNEFLDVDGRTVIGMDVELYDAIAGKLGLEVDWVPAQFGDIIPGVQSGKYEAGVSSFTINPEREQQALMISYFNSPIQWVTQKGNPKKVSIDNACGLRIGVQKDTVEVPDLQDRSKKCTDAGKPAITLDQYPGQDTVTSNLVTGKDDAMTADLPIAVYAVKQSQGKLELLGEPYGNAPYGIVVGKDQAKFAEAIQKATQAIIDDGGYDEILRKWGNEKGAITSEQVQVNPSTP